MSDYDTVKLLEQIIRESRAADAKMHKRLDVLAENQRHIMLAVAGLSDELRELRSHNEDQHNRSGARIKELERAQKDLQQHQAQLVAQYPAE